jgi:hypothetical protein
LSRKLLTAIRGPDAAAILRSLDNGNVSIIWQPVENAAGELEVEVWEDI